VAEQDLARVGEGDRRIAALAIDQPHPDQVLELTDLLADRRLHVAKPIGRAAKRAFLADRAQRNQMAKLDSVPA
jgi:hypothetical protein